MQCFARAFRRQQPLSSQHWSDSASCLAATYDLSDTNKSDTQKNSSCIITSKQNDFLRFASTHWLLGVALAVGLTARLLLLSSHSLLLDEAFVAIGARDMLLNSTPMWDAISNAPFVWLVAHGLGRAGIESTFWLRFPAALIGAASILPLYLLASRLLGRQVAIIAAFLFALHPFAVAFSRVLFADPFQVFCILCGFLAFDQLAARPWKAQRGRRVLTLIIALIWAGAFLMKYNAVVPGALWLLAGVLGRRYSIGSAMVAFVAMTTGAIFTLLLWPFDAPVWLAAFLEKGGSYDLRYAIVYFTSKIHLVFYGATELVLVLGLVFGFSNRGRTASCFAHLTTFLLLYLGTISLLGRSFERYLLITVPIGCLLVSAVVLYLYSRMFQVLTRWAQVGIVLFTVGLAIVFLAGVTQSYQSYHQYLRNDYDHEALANNARSLEQQGRSGYWYCPEPIAAYYLGYTRHYSRSTIKGPSYSDGLPSNYFEQQSVPYESKTPDYGVLAVRRLLRTWSARQLLQHPQQFIDSARRISRSAHNAPLRPTMDYMSSDAIPAGSLLVMESGIRDVQGEPILEKVRKEDAPPMFLQLPLKNFEIARVFRSEERSLPSDTLMDPIRAGGWILIKK